MLTTVTSGKRQGVNSELVATTPDILTLILIYKLILIRQLFH